MNIVLTYRHKEIRQALAAGDSQTAFPDGNISLIDY